MGKIRTYSGLLFDVMNPDPKQIRIRDVAHHLSLINRFTGATKHHYSVAQHSVYASQLVPERFALEALLHDGPEFCMNDINRPLKYQDGMAFYRQHEKVVWSAFAKRFGLPETMSPEVKLVDDRLCATEGLALLKDYQNHLGVRPFDIQIEELKPAEAERAFLDRFYELYEPS